MSKKNVEIVHAIEAAWDAGKLDELEQYFAPDFHSHAAVPGMPQDHATRTMIHGMSMAAMPDRKVEVVDTIAEGDRVVVRCRTTGTNSGGFPWLGAEANGGKIEIEWISIYRLEKGKVVEHWGINDGITLLAQTGAWAPPPMPGM